MVKQVLIDNDDGLYVPDANLLVTEDDTLDNFPSSKNKRLLVSSLYSSLQKQPFLAESNVGVYYTDLKPAIVPDVFLSLNVQVPQNWWEKQNRCYMVWRFGKPPEVAIEIVSNKVGDELEEKLRIYEHMRASYYVVYDPTHQLSQETLRIYELRGMRYFQTSETWLEQVGLGLTLWEGEFEARQDSWLRWCYQNGTVLPTGDERAQTAEQRASSAEERAAQLAEKLREMGINPNTM